LRLGFRGTVSPQTGLLNYLTAEIQQKELLQKTILVEETKQQSLICYSLWATFKQKIAQKNFSL
jgi:hypothetical protein